MLLTSVKSEQICITDLALQDKKMEINIKFWKI